MIISKPFPGCVYGDNLPSGEFAVGHPGRRVVLIDGAEIPMPEREIEDGPKLMFTRITNVGGFKIAAKSHTSFITHVWDHTGWREEPNSHGTQGHIWHPETGELVIIQGADHQDSQGLRYYDPHAGPGGNLDVTGRTPGFVTGSPTYNDQSPFAQRMGVKRLYEWTMIGGIAVGQGEEAGLVIQYRGEHYRLLGGDCRFVQFKMDGDRLAIATTRFAQNDVVLFWLNVEDITSLPRAYVTTPPPPPPVGEKMRLPDQVYDIYRRVYEKFPDLFLSHSEDKRREGNRRAIATLKKRVPRELAERIVWKTAHSNGDSPSKDAMGIVPDAPLHEIVHMARLRMLVWDMVNGDPRFLKDNHENDYDLDNQYVVLEGVEPHDYLEDGEEPGPVDPGPVDPGTEPPAIGRSVKHPWWRGDDEPRDDCNRPMTGGGDCDRGKADPIHQAAPPDPHKPPPDPQKPPVDPKPGPVTDYQNKVIDRLDAIIKLLTPNPPSTRKRKTARKKKA